MTTGKTCEYCDKRGIPILPLRYAVAEAGSGAPQAADSTVPLPAESAHYTCRLLRSGYLYVFDEARETWDDYFVMPDGYFFRLHAAPGRPLVLPQKPFNCADLGHAEVASCITIPDPDGATRVWMAFSDVQWTEAVRRMHAQAAYRARHMRCLTVNAFAAGSDARHCLPIAQVGVKVAEYALPEMALKAAVGFSPFAIAGRQGRDARLVTACERLRPGKGFAVALADPAGIAAELGALMQHKFDTFVGDKAWSRPLAVSNAIAQVEAVVREQARVAEELAAEELANQQVAHNPLGHWLSQDTRDRTEQIRDVTPAEARSAEDRAWAKYSSKFDASAAGAWRAQFNDRLKELDEKHIAPLAQAHVAWMRHAQMAAAFECNFDATDAPCGAAYAHTLLLCLGSTQDKAACLDLYSQWLQGSVKDKTNLLLRALALNLDAAAEKIQQAAAATPDWRNFQWDALNSGLGDKLESVLKPQPALIGRLVQASAGAWLKHFAKALDGKVRDAMVALSLHTGMGFVVVEVQGSRKKLLEALTRQLIKAGGRQIPSEHQIRRAVAAQLRRLELAGVPLKDIQTRRVLLLVDPNAMAGMPQGNNAQRAAHMAGAIRTPEQFEAYAHGNWRVRLSNPGAGMALLRGGVPMVTGIVGGLLQYAALTKLVEDDDKAMQHEARDAMWRLRAGVVALGGTLTELTGMAVQKVAVVVPKAARGLGFVANALKYAGQTAGMLGALVVAWFDWQKGDEAASEGQHGLKWIYRGSAALGVGAALALLFGAPILGTVLVVLLITITLLIEMIKDNKLHDWLERCYWGNGPGERYGSAEVELAELRKALA